MSQAHIGISERNERIGFKVVVVVKTKAEHLHSSLSYSFQITINKCKRIETWEFWWKKLSFLEGFLIFKYSRRIFKNCSCFTHFYTFVQTMTFKCLGRTKIVTVDFGFRFYLRIKDNLR